MSTIIIVGVLLIHVALILYTIFIISEFRKKKATNLVAGSISVAVLTDLTATIFMMIEAESVHLTTHGAIGYLGVLIMLVNAIFVWRHRLSEGIEAPLTKRLLNYSLLAYIWWLIAFITGMVMSLSN